MTYSLILLPLRLGIRTARTSLHATRDLADLGLATLEMLERTLGDESPDPVEDPARPAEDPARPAQDPARPAEPAAGSLSDREGQKPSQRARPGPRPQPSQRPPRPTPAPAPAAVPDPEPLPDERELVEEVADPGAEDGAGASLRVAPPFAGYDELRAADVIARLGGAELAELGETELYERTHRARRTVLEAIEREIKRRPPGQTGRRP